ncbi:hypothetical protein SKAU_G00339750 [Synaphobranchus kaupii]|uniref:Uncharacterized protein n=1 Tax=Synaphobranchus kaupii TaxID=118154 RepID=A0A9Q1IJE8_SYNKA|nr:hypothetical protein SKAU_G00339750 [Synaphobranchus kaupii]
MSGGREEQAACPLSCGFPLRGTDRVLTRGVVRELVPALRRNSKSSSRVAAGLRRVSATAEEPDSAGPGLSLAPGPKLLTADGEGSRA